MLYLYLSMKMINAMAPLLAATTPWGEPLEDKPLEETSLFI